MQTQIHTGSWMISLGIISPDPKLYENKDSGMDLTGEYKPRNYAKTLPKEARNKLRRDIMNILSEDVDLKCMKVYERLSTSGLIPQRIDGRLLTPQALYEYVKRCRKDSLAGITDEQIIALHQSGMPIRHIAKKLDMGWYSVRDRLICNNIIEGE